MSDSSLENKFRLATIAPLDRRMKRKHLAVYGFILDWYHKKYGDALASVRHIVAQLKERDPSGIGLYTGDVHSALTDLVAWGYITQEKGSGRRASRYVPDWAHGSSVRKTPNTTEDEISVRENQNADVRETPNTSGDSVQRIQNKDPSTVTRLQDGVTVIDGLDCAPASPPPTVGLEAPAAGGAQGGFEELWKTYFPKRGQGDKKKARAAYERIAPDADLHAAMVDAARAWFEAWAAQGKPGAPRKHLDTWLTNEHFECDPPTAYQPKEKKPAKPEPANNNEPVEDDIPEFMIGRPGTWPVGEYEGEFQEASVVDEHGGKDKCVTLTFVPTVNGEYGKPLLHRFYVESWIESAQKEGQQCLQDIVNALGLAAVTDTDELLFQPLRVRADGRSLYYSKIEEAA